MNWQKWEPIFGAAQTLWAVFFVGALTYHAAFSIAGATFSSDPRRWGRFITVLVGCGIGLLAAGIYFPGLAYSLGVRGEKSAALTVALALAPLALFGALAGRRKFQDEQREAQERAERVAAQQAIPERS